MFNNTYSTFILAICLSAQAGYASTTASGADCTLKFTTTGDPSMSSFYGEQLLSVLQSSGYDMQDNRAACCALDGLGSNSWTPPLTEVGGAWGLQTAQQFANNAGMTAHASWKGKSCSPSE